MARVVTAGAPSSRPVAGPDAPDDQQPVLAMIWADLCELFLMGERYKPLAVKRARLDWQLSQPALRHHARYGEARERLMRWSAELQGHEARASGIVAALAERYGALTEPNRQELVNGSGFSHMREPTLWAKAMWYRARNGDPWPTGNECPFRPAPQSVLVVGRKRERGYQSMPPDDIITLTTKSAGALRQQPPAWPHNVGGCATVSTVRVPLSQGKFALIDAEDAERVLACSWHAFKIHRRWYAATSVRGKRVYLHRFLLPDAPEVDHKDRDGLNNTRANLRPCTHSQNIANADFPIGPSGYRGVYFFTHGKRKKRWCARIKIMQKNKTLGYFTTPEEAARVYDKAARKAFGEFARQNFSEDMEDAT